MSALSGPRRPTRHQRKIHPIENETNLVKTFFQHESLPAYQAALEFAKWSEAVLERTPKNSAAYAQLDQGRIALSCKIAAANGRLPASEQCGLLAAAQRIALESAACLDLLFNK